jgi:hypothetical protein
MDIYDLMWLVGYLEGEGTFICSIMKGGRYASIQISGSSTDEDIAARASALLGKPSIGPYTNKGSLGKKPYWIFAISGERAARLMVKLPPFMGIHRQAQIDKSLALWEARPTRHRETGLPPDCHPDKVHYARGLCRPCHYKFFRYDIHKLSEEAITDRLAQRPMSLYARALGA